MSVKDFVVFCLVIVSFSEAKVTNTGFSDLCVNGDANCTKCIENALQGKPEQEISDENEVAKQILQVCGGQIRDEFKDCKVFKKPYKCLRRIYKRLQNQNINKYKRSSYYDDSDSSGTASDSDYSGGSGDSSSDSDYSGDFSDSNYDDTDREPLHRENDDYYFGKRKGKGKNKKSPGKRKSWSCEISKENKHKTVHYHHHYHVDGENDNKWDEPKCCKRGRGRGGGRGSGRGRGKGRKGGKGNKKKKGDKNGKGERKNKGSSGRGKTTTTKRPSKRKQRPTKTSNKRQTTISTTWNYRTKATSTGSTFSDKVTNLSRRTTKANGNTRDWSETTRSSSDWGTRLPFTREQSSTISSRMSTNENTYPDDSPTSFSYGRETGNGKSTKPDSSKITSDWTPTTPPSYSSGSSFLTSLSSSRTRDWISTSNSGTRDRSTSSATRDWTKSSGKRGWTTSSGTRDWKTPSNNISRDWTTTSNKGTRDWTTSSGTRDWTTSSATRDWTTSSATRDWTSSSETRDWKTPSSKQTVDGKHDSIPSARSTESSQSGTEDRGKQTTNRTPTIFYSRETSYSKDYTSTSDRTTSNPLITTESWHATTRDKERTTNSIHNAPHYSKTEDRTQSTTKYNSEMDNLGQTFPYSSTNSVYNKTDRPQEEVTPPKRLPDDPPNTGATDGNVFFDRLKERSSTTTSN